MFDQADVFERMLFGEAVEIAPSSASPIATARASRWLRHCLENHDRCRVDTAGFMPRRLLKIGTPTDGQVSVVETAELTQQVQFAALSYCWGPDTSGVRTTTRSNRGAHAAGIDVAKLPQTVQDALTVCTSLGMAYLWVDALCIVQDDADDWRSESARMMDIYANSVITVTAMEPDSCMKGFLGPQSLGTHAFQHKINVHVPSSLGGPADHLFARGDMVSHPGKFSLDLRGWCLQESVLPPRRLVFDGIEMSWHCFERSMCECGHMDENSCGDFAHLKMQPEWADTSSSQLADVYSAWLDLAREYSQRHLTRSSDKLVAISGLAALLEKRVAGLEQQHGDKDVSVLAHVKDFSTGVTAPRYAASSPFAATCGPGDYFAGIWKAYLVPSMSWTIDTDLLARSNRHVQKRYSEYCAPSWSWASIDGPVRFPHMDVQVGRWDGQSVRLTCDVVVEDVRCVPVDPSNQYGALSSAFIQLTGPMVPVELRALHIDEDSVTDSYAFKSDGDTTPVRYLVRSPDLKSCHVELDIEQPSLMVDRGTPQVQCWKLGECVDWFGGKYPHQEEGTRCCTFDAETPYACLRLLSAQWPRGAPMEDQWVLSFLLLRRIPHTDTYERVGLGQWDTDKRTRWMERADGETIRLGIFSRQTTATVKVV